MSKLSRIKRFELDLTDLINKHSLENGSDTPDYLLAAYLINCLRAYEDTVQPRDNWHGFKPEDRS